MILLNSLKSADIVFFVMVFVLVGLTIGAYFLAPVIKRKKYKEQRDKFHERELIFKSKLSNYQETEKDDKK